MKAVKYFNKYLEQYLAPSLLLIFTLTTLIMIINNQLLYAFVGLTFSLSCIIWLIIRNKKIETKFSSITHPSKHWFKIMNILFFLFLTFILVSIHTRPFTDSLPLVYYILVSLLIGVVVFESIALRDDRKILPILIQILIIGLILVWSQQYIFPDVVGIDAPWHRFFTKRLIESQYIPESLSYSNLPLMHIGVGSTILIGDVAYRMALTSFVSFPMVACFIFFSYLLGKYVINEKAGLLSGLFICTANLSIHFGWSATPNAMGAAIIFSSLYSILKIRANNPLTGTALSVLLLTSLALTHTVAAAGMLVILSSLSLLRLTCINNHVRKHAIPSIHPFGLMFAVITFAWWSYDSGHITNLGNMIRWGFSIDALYSAPIDATPLVAIPFATQLLFNLGYILFLSLSLIGILYTTSTHSNCKGKIIAISAGATLFVGLLSSIAGLEVLNIRWLFLSQALLSIPAAIGFIALVSLIRRPSGHLTMTFFITTVLFLLIIGSGSNVNNTMFSDNDIRYAFIEPEFVTASFASQRYEGSIYSDFDYASNPSSSVFSNYYGVQLSQISSIDDQLINNSFNSDGLIIIRYEIIDSPFRLEGGQYKIDYDLKECLMKNGYSHIYSNHYVSCYN